MRRGLRGRPLRGGAAGWRGVALQVGRFWPAVGWRCGLAPDAAKIVGTLPARHRSDKVLPHRPFIMMLLKRFAPALAGLLLGFGVAAGSAQTALPPAVGTAAANAAAALAQDGVTTRDAEWLDGTRQRMVPVRIYLPASVSGPARAKLPLVLFSHGLGGTRMGYSHLGRHFAQNGFIAVHVQHAGSDRAVWQGGPFALLGNLRDAASEVNALARVQDVSFALTTLLADRELGGLIDSGAIAIAGHSYGANTAMLIAGAAVERDGRRVSFADARIKAAILLSAPPFHGEGNQVAVLRDVRLPTLHITGSDDVIRVPGYGSDVADRIGVFRDMPALPDKKFLAIFEGGEHSVFTDRTRTERALAIKAATRDLCVAFLRSTLLREGGAMEPVFTAVKGLLIEPDRLMARRLDAHLRSN